jgi:hypothetical protein
MLRLASWGTLNLLLVGCFEDKGAATSGPGSSDSEGTDAATIGSSDADSSSVGNTESSGTSASSSSDTTSGTETGESDSDSDGPDTEDTEPTEVTWAAVAAGALHTCGLRSDGTLWCWGRGAEGQLGYGGMLRRDQPTRVGGSPSEEWSDWTAVAAGGRHTCGIRAGGQLWCWGARQYGRLGDGTAEGEAVVPTRVLSNTGGDEWDDWVLVSAGDQHTCGIRNNAWLWCWGYGYQGQRGDGTTLLETHSLPVQVVAAMDDEMPWEDWESVSAGQQFTCGVRQDGTAWCWGLESNGRLGNGSTGNLFLGRPVRLVNGGGDDGPRWADWEGITASLGGAHGCGWRTEDGAWCWGLRNSGQHGVGDYGPMTSTGTPTQVIATEDMDTQWDNWIEISAGNVHTCGRRSNGVAYCWGAGDHGRLGDGMDRMDVEGQSHWPVAVVANKQFPPTVWDDWQQIAAGGTHTCGRREDGSLWCWGNGGQGQRGDGSTALERNVPARVLDPS